MRRWTADSLTQAARQHKRLEAGLPGVREAPRRGLPFRSHRKRSGAEAANRRPRKRGSVPACDFKRNPLSGVPDDEVFEGCVAGDSRRAAEGCNQLERPLATVCIGVFV